MQKDKLPDSTTMQTPVVIVGAGPAGAAASIYLSKAGIRHVILEKEKFPRQKVCGDGISGKSAHVLRKANPQWLQEVFQQPEKFTPSSGIIFVAPNGKPLRIPYGHHLNAGELAPGFTSQRLVFDQFLFDKIDREYATVFEEARILSIEKETGGVTVSFQQQGRNYIVHAPVILACDGDKSRVRRAMETDSKAEKPDAAGLRAYYRQVTGMDADGYIELHFLKALLPGYFWIFPLPNGLANIGVVMPGDVIRKKKANLKKMMLQAIAEHPDLRHRFKDALPEGKIEGWGLPLATKKRSISGDHYLLCGDAAKLIDPFSGEGIGNAMYSGMLAAEAISVCLRDNDFSAAALKERYDVVLYKRLGAELQLSATLQRLCRFPWLFNMVVNKAAKSPTLNQMISGMFTDLNLREQLRRPGFYAKILLNR